MLRVFSLLLFVYLLVDSFLRSSLFLVEEFVNNSSETSLSFYVFSHSYQSEVSFWV